MDRKSWPWKKKSTDKSAAEKAIATLDAAGLSLPSGESQSDKDNYKKPNYVQISVESYAHLTGLEDQVKAYEEQVKTYEDQLKTLDEQVDELNEKLSAAHTEMTDKEELVKQHAKVAEEAVSGWEKAEAEAATLKTHLESVTLSKLTAEDRAAHLDNALKECMRQIRNLKEEHEKKVQDVVLAKNLQMDKTKREFEAHIAQLDQEILRAEGENSAVLRSLQERSNMLIKINGEKSETEAEIELLKSKLETCEREINSLKYELHVVSKELEIRNEERNMSTKTAEVTTKQHIESVKKIAKLEAECQRLRGLVKKKLPGPAAIAQMKLEVESLGRDYGETRRRSPVKPASPHLSPHHRTAPGAEFSFDGSQKIHRENEFLTERLLAMEEETKMLKEALAKRNSELQASRSLCAKTANKLQSLESQLQVFGPSIQNASDPPSLTSLSEDGNDDAASVAESWASALISELSHVKEKNKDISSRTDSANHLELMDDFLEMEKLARLPNDSSRGVSLIGSIDNKGSEAVNHRANGADGTELQSGKQPEATSLSEAENTTPDADSSFLRKVQSRISEVFGSVSDDADVGKILEEIKRIVQETLDTLHQHPVSCVFVEKHCSEDVIVTDKEVSLHENGAQNVLNEIRLSKELEAAISEIQTFVLSLRKEVAAFQGTSVEEDGLNRKIELFSATCNKALCNELNLNDIIVSLSNVVVKVGDLSFNIMGYKSCEIEATTPDCVDKVALPENKEAQPERYPSGISHASDSSSNSEFPSEANILQGLDAGSCKCSLEEFEQMKVDKDKMERDLARSTEDLENTKSQLKETEQILAEVKSQLTSSQKTNSLAETQLKCMAGSYNSLEKRAEELVTEVNLLQSRVESLEIELQTEKVTHQDALARCEDLEEQLKRNEECSMCSSLAADLESKCKQEKDLAAAAERLADCQETIFILGRQLKALRPQTDVTRSPQNESNHRDHALSEEGPAASGMSIRELSDQAEMDTATSPHFHNVGAESPMDLQTALFSPFDNEFNGLGRSAANSKTPNHRPTKSGSSSASSTPTPEKHSRGFSRFFSSKGNNRH